MLIMTAFSSADMTTNQVENYLCKPISCRDRSLTEPIAAGSALQTNTEPALTASRLFSIMRVHCRDTCTAARSSHNTWFR